MSPSHALPVHEGTLRVPDATLYYEVRGSGPLIALIGSPMGTEPFRALADLFAHDHAVLTADPRGIGRSRLDDPTSDSTPEQRADDLSRLLTHLDRGSAAVVGSSGGAVTALALAQSHPDQVHTVVAHEPPLEELLDDRERHRENAVGMIATYRGGDVVGAWRQFFGHAKLAIPDDAVEQMFGPDRDPQDIADEYYFFCHALLPTTTWEPDLTRLRTIPTRIVVGIGEASAGQLCDATSTALAAGLDLQPTSFPGGHTGFAEQPHEFAERLRSVLGSAATQHRQRG